MSVSVSVSPSLTEPSCQGTDPVPVSYFPAPIPFPRCGGLESRWSRGIRRSREELRSSACCATGGEREEGRVGGGGEWHVECDGDTREGEWEEVGEGCVNRGDLEQGGWGASEEESREGRVGDQDLLCGKSAATGEGERGPIGKLASWWTSACTTKSFLSVSSVGEERSRSMADLLAMESSILFGTFADELAPLSGLKMVSDSTSKSSTSA